MSGHPTQKIGKVAASPMPCSSPPLEQEVALASPGISATPANFPYAGPVLPPSGAPSVLNRFRVGGRPLLPVLDVPYDTFAISAQVLCLYLLGWKVQD